MTRGDDHVINLNPKSCQMWCVLNRKEWMTNLSNISKILLIPINERGGDDSLAAYMEQVMVSY